MKPPGQTPLETPSNIKYSAYVNSDGNALYKMLLRTCFEGVGMSGGCPGRFILPCVKLGVMTYDPGD